MRHRLAAAVYMAALTATWATDRMSIIITPEEVEKYAPRHVGPMIMIETVRGEGDPAPTMEDLARQVNEADAWTCKGDPPKCERMSKDAKGVMYYGADEVHDHRGMGTRWLGGPSLTMDNIWENKGEDDEEGQRPPTASIRVDEGTSPTLKSGLHLGAKPYRVQWAFNKVPLYDHTNGLPDDGKSDHHTHFWIGELFDMNLVNVTARDTGRYTAVFRLHEVGPILETEINMTVQYLPTPMIFGGKGQPNKIRIRADEHQTTATCLATVGEPRAQMTWLKDGQRIRESNITDDSDSRRTLQTIRVSKEDEGALITCKMTSSYTSEANTASVKVRRDRASPPRVGAKLADRRAKILQPVAVAALTAVALVCLIIGATGTVMLRKRSRSARQASGNGERPSTDRTSRTTV